MSAERLGKSSVAFWAMLWRIRFKPKYNRMNLIVYKSDDFAKTINETKFEPTLNSIEEFRREIDRPFSKRRDFYNVFGCRIYFQGSGSDIIGLDIPFRYADELDFWEDSKGKEGKVNNLINLRKRGYTFAYSMLVKSSSPTTKGGRINKEFKKSSRGYWHLRCQGCGELTMRSCDVHNLQWEMRSIESDKEELEIVPESLRLVCPQCKREHIEPEKRKMNIEGGFIHQRPELKETHAGYQMGALASQMAAHTWLMIANAQLEAGRRADIEYQTYFDNTIRGLPFAPRKSDVQDRDVLLKHCGDAPNHDHILNLFMGVDTQDNGYYYTILAYCAKGNMHIVGHGFETSNEQLMKVFHSKPIADIPIIAMIVDEGGHRPQDVAKLVLNAGVYAWKGGWRGQEKWVVSKTNRKRLLGRAKQFQTELLYYLYSQPDRSNSYLFFPQGLENMPNGMTLIEHLAAMKPNKKKRDGDLYENWECDSDRTDHYFDCLKITLCLIEYAKRYFKPDYWRKCSAKSTAAVKRRVPSVPLQLGAKY